MKTLWTALSVLAVANLLAMIGLVGWLRASHRLDVARLREVRQILAETAEQRLAREDAAKAEAEALKRAEQERARAAIPPVPAEGILQIKLEQSQADQARQDNLRREAQILQETLARERRALDADKAALARERAEFERARQLVMETEGNAQFKKTLGTLEALKPDKARAMLQVLIDGQQMDQVVAYLNAMQERTRTKLINEFAQTDPKVATDLLERLRQRGIRAAVPPPEGAS
jgi:hypothetical protein